MFIPEQQAKGYYITLAGTCFNCGENSPLDFRGAKPFTIEGWVSRPAKLRAAATAFSKPGELIFGLTASAHVFAQRFPSRELLIGPTALVADVWYHVGLTFDGLGMALYVNGLGDARASDDVRLQACKSSASCFRAPRELASQAIDVCSVRLWNTARTEDEMFQAPWEPIGPRRGLIYHYFPEVPRSQQPRIEEPASVWSGDSYRNSAAVA